MIVEFSLYPLDKGPRLSKYVARSLDIIDRSGLPYRAGPMGTAVEGGWDECFALVKKCYTRMSKDCDRVALTLKADWRRGAKGRLEGKLSSVETRLGRRLRR